MKAKWLITVASWEERFLLGTMQVIRQHKLTGVVMFYYQEFEEWSRMNRDQVKSVCQLQGIAFKAVLIEFGNSPETWRTINASLGASSDVAAPALIDFTTMPRETLWVALSVLRCRGISTTYIYHPPEDYHPEWLSRDPGRPRLVYKLSGIATLGQQTCLVITTGFDPERTRQLMWYYEPRRILLGFQSGDQFQNRAKNVERHQEALKEEYREFEVQEFEVNAYAEDRGESALLAQVEQWRATHNIVMTSLGPKLGAIALFRVHCRYPETALSYTPSREFNQEYSKGISEAHSGALQW